MRIAFKTSSPSIGGLAKKFRYVSSTGRPKDLPELDRWASWPVHSKANTPTHWLTFLTMFVGLVVISAVSLSQIDSRNDGVPEAIHRFVKAAALPFRPPWLPEVDKLCGQ